MTKLKTRLLKDLPVKTTPITDEDYVINSNNGTTKLKVKDITKNLEQNVNKLNNDVKEILEKGTTVETIKNATEKEIQKQIASGNMSNLAIPNGSIGKEKLSSDIKIAILDKLTENDGSLFFNGKEVGKKAIDDSIISPEYAWSSDKIKNELFTKVRTENLYNKDNAILDKVISNTGGVIGLVGYSYNEEYIDVSVAHKYINISSQCLIAEYDQDKTFLKLKSWKQGAYVGNSTKYIRVCVPKNQINSFVLVADFDLPTEYTPYYKELLKNSENSIEILEKLKIGKKHLSQEMLPIYLICDSIPKYTFINYDLKDFIGKSAELKIKVSYKIKLTSIANSANIATLNYRLLNHAVSGFKDISQLNVQMGEVSLGLGSENKITYEYALTKVERYLKIMNYVKTTSSYDIWDLEVSVNDVSISPFEEGSFHDSATNDSGTVININNKGYTLATIEYLNKVGISGSNSSGSTNKLKGKKGTFMGDSITHLGDYPTTLKKIFELSEVVKVAYMGWKVKDLVSNMQKIPADTDFISVWISINDFRASTILGVNSDRTNDTFYGALHNLCTYLASNFVGKKIAFYTPLHQYNGDFTTPNSLNKNNLTLEDYRKVLREVCSYYSIPVCELHSKCGIAPHIPSHKTLYTTDGLHLTPRGYDNVVDCMVEFLKSI